MALPILLTLGQGHGRHITGRPPVSDVGKTSGGGDSRGGPTRGESGMGGDGL